ncbi:MAG: cupredoxin domain-containing protein [bacterium]|nr:cupredoxin domain-containing protein [bacterium]
MSIKGGLGLTIFFILAFFVLVFVLVYFFSSYDEPIKNFFFSKEKIAIPQATFTKGDVSVNNFLVNNHWLWMIEMRGEGNSFDPNSLVVNEGDIIDIQLSAIDRDYEIYLPGLGIYKLVPKGQRSEVQFQAYPAGEHLFACKDNCSNPPQASLVINK